MKTVIVATLDSFQAGILRNVLHNEGIESFIKNENMSSIYPGIPPFEIEVEVLEEDYLKAKEILKKGFPDLA
ncbi:MAG: DUF2007 domain-containing protein [Tannerella sp.]|jgi:hypothetical protein|nr:DUF2007 domain-containing protein [Tannerella sp.]